MEHDGHTVADVCKTRVQYLNMTVLRRGVGEVRVVAGIAPAC
jgi:hypothetical protein